MTAESDTDLQALAQPSLSALGHGLGAREVGLLGEPEAGGRGAGRRSRSAGPTFGIGLAARPRACRQGTSPAPRPNEPESRDETAAKPGAAPPATQPLLPDIRTPAVYPDEAAAGRLAIVIAAAGRV